MTAPFVIHHGECLEVLRTLPDCSIDSIVTDPPYGLSDHKPAEVVACLTAWLAGEPYLPKGKGFMGKTWDAWVPGPEVFRECLRVLKPGGHMLAFAGTRSMDMMSMAIRLAGFELRDSIGYAHDDDGGAPLLAWCYGSGFPKSMDVSRAIDKAAGAEREVVGIHPDAAKRTSGTTTQGGWSTPSRCNDLTIPATDAARQWEGWGTALKPAWEPIILARRPLEGTVAANVIANGTGALNIDGCRVGTNKNVPASPRKGQDRIYGAYGAQTGSESGHDPNIGRWPANLITDGSDAVQAAFPQASGAVAPVRGTEASAKTANAYGDYGGRTASDQRDGGGSAARFFYAAKASRFDRNEGMEDPGPQFKMGSTLRAAENLNADGARKGNTHPTVKPTDLMRYLCRLITPPGGTVLDPFFGSGSTGKGAILEGFSVVGIERDSDSVATAQVRCEHAVATVLAAKIEAEDSTRQAVLL